MGNKARRKKANGKGEPKGKKKVIWPEALKDYPSLYLDLRPEFFEASYRKLMEDIVILLGEEVDYEMSKLPKKDRKPSKVNGKQYTPGKGSGGFLVHLLPVSGDPKDEIILLYGLEDLYLQGFHDGEVWFLLLEATVAIPPSTQVPYGRPTDLEEGEESPFDNGIHIFYWSGRYPDLEGGQMQPFYFEAFRDARDKLKQARKRVLRKDDFKLQRPVAFFAVSIAEAVRFETLGDWVLIQSTDPLLSQEDGVYLPDDLDKLTNRWGTESDACYGPDHLDCVRVVKRNPQLHSQLEPEILYQKKETKKTLAKETEQESKEEVKEQQKPFVLVKETIQGEGVDLIESLEGSMENAERTTPDGKFAVRVRVFRLPDTLTRVLNDNAEPLTETICSQDSHNVGSSATELRDQMITALDKGIEEISATLESSRLVRYRETMIGHFNRIWALGPSQAPPNLLLSPDEKGSHGPTTSQDGREGILVCDPYIVSQKLGFVSTPNADTNICVDDSELSRCAPYSEALSNSIILGFHLATCHGPLCDEPVWGLAFIIEPFIFSENSNEDSYQDCTFSWQITMAVREACIAVMRQSNPRIAQPICLCELTMPSHRFDAASSVLRDCKGKVLREVMPEGAPLFTIHAHLPAIESTKFLDNLRKKTSAATHTYIGLSHWEAIPQDPFFIPKTQEEIEEFGAGPSLARTLMDSVRQRKGLEVEGIGQEQQTCAEKVMERKEQIHEDIDKVMAINEEAIQGPGLEVLEPLVSFRETIAGGKGHMEFVERTTPDGKFAVRIGVCRLPDGLTRLLDDSADLLAETIGSLSSHDIGTAATELREKMVRAIDNGLESISGKVNLERRKLHRKKMLGHFQRIWALGPSQAAPNLLLSPDVESSSSVITSNNGREGILVSGRYHVSERLGFVNVETDKSIGNSALATDVPEPEALQNSIVLGFQVAASAGPLCDEPMWGLAFIAESYTFADRCSNPYEQRIFSWHVSEAVREACRAAVLQSKPRLVEFMVSCELTTPTEELGAARAVLRDCRATVLKEEMQEGTSLVQANLPVAESSEFSEKLRNRTSGAASACLVPSHWQAIPQDPFLIPRTPEEIKRNFSRTLVHFVRRRKGLYVVEDKVSEDGTEQPTGEKKL